MSGPGAGPAPDGPAAPFALRALGPDDAETVADLEGEVFAEDPWSRAAVEEELRAPGRRYVAAVDGGEILGYAGIRLGPDADIMTIGVREGRRGSGVGRALLADLLRAARESGSQRVFLEVRPSNEAALGLYARAGFRPIGRVRRYFRNPSEDAVTMRLDIMGARRS